MNRVLPRTGFGTTAARGATAFVTCVVMCCALVAQPLTRAGADEYDDRKRIQNSISAQENAVKEADQRLVAAQAASTQAQALLAAAKADLATSITQRTEAQSLDAVRGEELRAGEKALELARAELSKSQAELAAERRAIGQVASAIYQQGGELQGMALMLRSKSTNQFADRMQWTGRVMDERDRAMRDLEFKRARNELMEDKQKKAEAAARSAKEAAAAALAARQAAEKSAQEKERIVGERAAEAERTQLAADEAARKERENLAAQRAEQAAVEARIRARIAREKAAEKARRAEEQRRRANNGGPAPAPIPNNPGGFISPVAGGYVTSGYGMRWHPVIGGWIFHDGTDYGGVGCGAPMRAAAAGTVVENYFDSTGFGKRLIIDHGRLGGGSYFSTGYNHAESYIVSVGQRVEQGQVIGYIGTTGYSTGCHLHLNLWIDGAITDPVGSGNF